MLDLKFIRDNPQIVKDAVTAKGEKSDIDAILKLDIKRRELIAEKETLEARRNKVSKDISLAKKQGQDTAALVADMRTVGDKIDDLANQLKIIEEGLDNALLTVPNIPHKSVPIAHDESGNVIVRYHGEKKELSFKPRPHWEIGEILGALDLAGGVKLSGSGFYALKGQGARLERALIDFMLDLHTKKQGYTEVMIPYMVGSQAMRGTGQLPKLAEDMYKLSEEDLYLIPTAEVPVTNLHAGDLLSAEDLPIYYCAFSPCFRREAGSYGKEVRGITRVHQFHKVEMVKIVEPESSYDELEKLVGDAEEVLRLLGLHYRVNLLCTGDLSFSAAKCYDLEVYVPGMDTWLEVSSCSNFEAFQARRMDLRYRPEKGAKPVYVHTLNGSGLALPRTMIAVLENYQQRDGSVLIPDALRPYFDNKEILEPI
jgi:seryl-tRNA synthetase